MGWRSELEDLLTVTCRKCGHESIDWRAGNRRKWNHNQCSECGYDPQEK